MGSDLELNVNVSVSNYGEDSYGTTVTLFYPVGLSFRRVAEGRVLLRGREEVSGLCSRFKAQAGWPLLSCLWGSLEIFSGPGWMVRLYSLGFSGTMF